MKNLLLVFMASILLAGCQKDGFIGPDEQLYKRWYLYRVRNSKDSAWIMYDTDAYYDTEYKADGSLVYRRNGVETATTCCSGSRFIRDGAMILYTNFPSCPAVKCADNTKALITILRDDLLELQIGERIIQYTPAN